MAREVYELVLAGLVQGFLEWLPVSSSGNVALLFMGLVGYSPIAAVKLALALHFATALAGSTYYYRFVFNALRDPLGLEARILLVPLATGAPTGYFFYRAYEETATGMSLDAVMVLIGGLLVVTGSVLVAQGWSSGSKGVSEVGLKDLLVLGFVEGVAVLPGLSRSGLVSAYMLLRGYNPSASIKVGFVTGIPSTLLAALYTLYQGGAGAGLGLPVLLGLVAAYSSGLVALALLDRLAERMVKRIGLFLIVYGGLILGLHAPLLFAH